MAEDIIENPRSSPTKTDIIAKNIAPSVPLSLEEESEVAIVDGRPVRRPVIHTDASGNERTRTLLRSPAPASAVDLSSYDTSATNRLEAIAKAVSEAKTQAEAEGGDYMADDHPKIALEDTETPPETESPQSEFERLLERREFYKKYKPKTEGEKAALPAHRAQVESAIRGFYVEALRAGVINDIPRDVLEPIYLQIEPLLNANNFVQAEAALSQINASIDLETAFWDRIENSDLENPPDESIFRGIRNAYIRDQLREFWDEVSRRKGNDIVSKPRREGDWDIAAFKRRLDRDRSSSRSGSEIEQKYGIHLAELSKDLDNPAKRDEYEQILGTFVAEELVKARNDGVDIYKWTEGWLDDRYYRAQLALARDPTLDIFAVLRDEQTRLNGLEALYWNDAMERGVVDSNPPAKYAGLVRIMAGMAYRAMINSFSEARGLSVTTTFRDGEWNPRTSRLRLGAVQENQQRKAEEDRKAEIQEGGSDFEKLELLYSEARQDYIKYRALDGVLRTDPDRQLSETPQQITDGLKDALEKVRAYKEEIASMISEVGGKEILTGVMLKITEDYKKLRIEASPEDREDHIGELRRRHGKDWEATMWNSASNQGLRQRYKGLPNFIYNNLMDVIATDSRREAYSDEDRNRLIDKKDDEIKITIEPENLIEDDLFVDLKVEREIQRLLNLKADLDQFLRVTFRIEDESDFLILVPNRIRYYEKKTSEEAVNQQYQAIERGRGEISELVFQALDRFNKDFNLNLESDNLFVRRMITLCETRMNVFGGFRCVNRGGFEHYIHFRENDANNYVAHVESMYLEDQHMAPALHFITHGLDPNYDWEKDLFDPDSDDFGEYHRGCKDDEPRPEEGAIYAFQRKRRDEIVHYLSTHELILKGRVDVRIAKEQRERALMTRTQKKTREAEIFAEERDRFLKEHSVFIRTLKRRDRTDVREAEKLLKKKKTTNSVPGTLEEKLALLADNQLTPQQRALVVTEAIAEQQRLLVEANTLTPQQKTAAIRQISANPNLSDVEKRTQIDSIRFGELVDEDSRREVVMRIIELKMAEGDFMVDEDGLTEAIKYKLDLVNSGSLGGEIKALMTDITTYQVGLAEEERSKRISAIKELKGLMVNQITYMPGLEAAERESRISSIDQGNLTPEQINFLQDKLHWGWVEGRNSIRANDKWYPTSWDEVRYLIDRPEKVLRRAMSAKEMFEMYRKVDAEKRRRRVSADQSFETARVYLIYEGIASRDGGVRIEVLEDDPDGDIDDPDGEIDPATGEIKKKRLKYSPEFAELWGMFNKVPRIDFLRADNPRPEFLPVDASDAEHNKTIDDPTGAIDPKTGQIRRITSDQALFEWYRREQEAYKPHRELRVRYENMMKGKIKTEKGGYRIINEAEKKQLEQELIELKDLGACTDVLAGDGRRRWIFFDGKFVVRDLLKEKGVSGTLPVWSTYLAASDIPLKEFAELLGVSPKSKQLVGMVGEMERRQVCDVTDQLVNAFMLKPFDAKDSPEGMLDSWNGVNILALRDNWKAGNIDLRKIFNARWYFSTSGGVYAKGLIPVMDLGVQDMWQEIAGARDAREFIGYVFMEDEVQFRRGPLWDTLDAVDYNKRLAAAEELRKIIGGGKVGDRQVLGFLNEVFTGAYKMRVERNNGDHVFKYITTSAEDYRWTYEDFDDLYKGNRASIDEFMEFAEPIFKPLINLMEGRRTLENRSRNASSQWKYDNTKIWYWYRNWLRYSPEVRRPPFAYANQARTELAIRIYEMVLQESGYILDSEPEPGKPEHDNPRARAFPEEWERNHIDRYYDYAKDNIYEGAALNNGAVIALR